MFLSDRGQGQRGVRDLFDPQREGLRKGAEKTQPSAWSVLKGFGPGKAPRTTRFRKFPRRAQREGDAESVTTFVRRDTED